METEHPFALIRAGKIIRKAWQGSKAIEIGEVKGEDPENSIRYFEKRFNELEDQVVQLENRVKNEHNKGSFLLKLKHIQTALKDHRGIGDYTAIDLRINQLITSIEQWVTENQQKNRTLKSSLINELKEAVEQVHWQDVSRAVHEIKIKWNQTGKVPENDSETLESEFRTLIQEFENRKKAFFDDKRKLQKHYQETYEDLIQRALKMKSSGSRKSSNKVEVLLQEWKANGGIAREIYQPLHLKFRNIISDLHREASSLNVSDIWTDINPSSAKTLSEDEIKELLSRLQSVRPKNKTEKEIRQKGLDLVLKRQEEIFINRLASKKFRDFGKRSKKEQQKLKSHILRDLIDRDKKDLDLYHLNQEKFNTRNESMEKMLKRKIDNQKKRIIIKEELLKELKT